ncbi:MAG: transporter substrate-binding domain-containing protein [Ruminococcaceae bacterium]|nr:transporter substrate-binding domain-containing protein [Oscillospiraceae bacterium]
MRKRVICLLAVLLLALSVLPVERAQAIPTRIRVAFNTHQAPYHFVDERGDVVGLHIDMLEHIAQRVGYELEYYPMETSTDCQNAINEGEVDLVLNISTRLENKAWITETLSDEAICIVTRNTPENAEGNVRGDAVVQLATITPAISTQISPAKTFAVSSQRKVVEFLLSGKADTAVVLKESALYYISGTEHEEDYVISNNYVGTLAFALQVVENDYQLLQTMDREIARLRTSDTYGELREKWKQSDAEEQNLIRMRWMVLVLIAAVMVVGLYAIIMSNVRRALRKQVDKQTLALQNANQEIRRHMEQLEAESDMRNRMIRYSHLAMVLFDETGHIMLSNDSAASLAQKWGGEGKLDRQEINRTPVFGEILRSCDTQSLFRDQSSGMEGVQTIMLKRGEKQYRYRYSLQRIFKAGKVWAVLLVVEDITDEEARRNAQFEEEKTRSLNQVVAGIAHEIKNPLTSIKTFVEVLRDADSDPQFMEDFVNYVPAEVERINRLVESLISYAKPARGARELVDLSEVAREIYFFAQNSNQNKRIVIQESIDDGHEIVGNRDQIRQILINIVINGMESMAEKLSGLPEDALLTLTLSLRKGGRGSLISIRDEGMGMSPEAIEQCLNPFFTTKRTGTGLGLTLSKQFAQDNNGELTITSKVGVYTEVQIEFGRDEHETENSDR